MRRFRFLIVKFAGLFNKERKDREFQEELESHVQMHIEDNLRLGMTPEEARGQTMIQLGGIEFHKGSLPRAAQSSTAGNGSARLLFRRAPAAQESLIHGRCSGCSRAGNWRGHDIGKRVLVSMEGTSRRLWLQTLSGQYARSSKANLSNLIVSQKLGQCDSK